MPHRDEINRLLAARKPLVVGAIADRATLETAPAGCDVVELRIDSLGFGKEVRRFAEESPLPVLVTVRGPHEGGAGDWSVHDRVEAYRALLPSAALIDVELRDFDPMDEVVDRAREEGVVVIGSFHDFKSTPTLEIMESKKDDRADLLKYALMTSCPEDIRTHLSLAEALGSQPFSLMGMGPLGAAARPLMARCGSLLNYGYLGNKPTAPNQWPAAVLRETLEI